MADNIIWAPWRSDFVLAHKKEKGCIFCNRIKMKDSIENLIVFRGSKVVVILNKFPYNNGHLMIVPRRHVARLADLDVAESQELMRLTQAAERVLTQVYAPHGFNMGVNLGKPAGAGIEDHLHVHIVPRWNGDTNFMSVVGETRVLPEELPATATRLRSAFDRVA